MTDSSSQELKSNKARKPSQKARNSAARLLAVQAVYQMLKGDQNADNIIREFLDHRAGMDVDEDGAVMVEPDVTHFSAVVKGVAENHEQLLEMITLNRGNASKKSFFKTEALLQSIFLCGSFELMVLQAIDFPVIISDYLHVTHAFYDDAEAKLVNAVLDSVRKTTRA